MSPIDPEPEYVIIAEGLEKKFGAFIAVDKVNFKIEKGKIYGFLGPNGAGKSTTIRMLCGLVVPTGGKATIIGYDIYKDAEKIKEKIGYMSQKFSLYEDLTVEENIDFYSGIYRVPEKDKVERKEWVIKMSGLTTHRDTRTSELAGGWKQRLALGCAILHRPLLLFLDEPTAGVDPINRRRFWNLIYDLADEGMTIFVTTHYMDEAEYVDDISFIYHGRVIAHGTPDVMKSTIMKEDVLEIFCDNPERAMEAIQKIEGVKEVALFGHGLHVVVERDTATTENLHSLLKETPYNVRHIAPISPSMEDVFVSLIETTDKQQRAR